MDKNSPSQSEKIVESFMQSVLVSNTPDDNNGNNAEPNSSSTIIDDLQQSLNPYFQTISMFVDLLNTEEPQAETTPNTSLQPKDSDKKEGNTSTPEPTSRLVDWLDLSYECNKKMFSETIKMFTNPSKHCNSFIDQLTTIIKQCMEGSTTSQSNLIIKHLSLMLKQLELSENTLRRLAGADTAPVISPCKTDSRFNDPEWQSNVLFDFIKQSYLLNSQAIMSIPECLDISPQKEALLNYSLRQISSALSPSNFALINPEVLRITKETNGENIYNGIKQLLEDQSKSSQYLNICMSDSNKFQLGKNIATTKGKIVFENDLMQLIQYNATTTKTSAVPLLIIPSWVNKYYILDLTPANSFVQWCVDQGLTVFMISWINPDESHRNIGFDDYLQLGILAAIDKIKTITKEKQVNTVGYCLGGILLATALAYLSHHKRDCILSATYLATSLDYSDPGDLGVFFDDKIISAIESMMDKEGYFDGRLLSISFNLLKENELYWNYYIQNYLKGERPKAFDILHWNSDNTNVPAKTHSFVLRDLHLNNGFLQEDAITLLDTPINLKKVKTPIYILATDKDHIAKWESAYSATQLHSGKNRFVLAGSGHIAGVINPPHKNKYCYHVNNKLPNSPQSWLKSASKKEGSWWNDWIQWINPYGGKAIKARTIHTKYIIENAPGRYVKKRHT